MNNRKTTTIKVNDDTKSKLNNKKSHPRESYEDVISRLLESETRFDEMMQYINTSEKKACFYLGVIFTKLYEGKTGKEIKNWDKIKTLNHKTLQFIFKEFTRVAMEKGLFYDNELYFDFVSKAILDSNELNAMNDDDMDLYYAFGKTFGHNFN